MKKQTKITIGLLVLAIIFWIFGYLLLRYGYLLSAQPPACTKTPCPLYAKAASDLIWEMLGSGLQYLSLILIVIDLFYTFITYLISRKRPKV